MLTAWRASSLRDLQAGLQPQYSGEVPKPRRSNSMDTSHTTTGTSSTASFERLAIPLLPSLLRQALWLTQNDAEAEDLAQEALSKALRAFSSFTPDTNFKAWIFRILRNTFLTTRTGVAAMRTTFLEDHEGLEESAVAAGSTPEETLIQLDDAAAVQQALTQLPPHLRDCLLLCDVEELKYKEIAEILDVPMGTVTSRIFRARAALRAHLQPHFGGRQ
jgi:RNA polymerase sigma-70 factor (ECF subfamily)